MDTKMLISEEYLKLQAALHAGPRGYGNSGRKHAGEVMAVAAAMNLSAMLDYGAGGGTLKHNLVHAGFPGTITEYDPAIPKINTVPLEQFDLVTCTDVLEHIEPDRLRHVLAHIHYLTRLAAFLVISCVPSSKFLRDGRNAHLIVQKPEWWVAAVTGIGFSIQSKYIRWNEQGPSELVLWVTR